jgi:hypothetical protein
MEAGMRVVWPSLSVLIASLVAWFGVVSAAPLHAHDLDASQSLFLHMVADDAHEAHGVDAHGHDHAEADAIHDGNQPDGNQPSDGETGEPVLHAHGCTHVATTVNGDLRVSHAGPMTSALWFEVGYPLSSVGFSPPRKPPRPLL